MSEEKKYIPSNIRVLRTEARLSIEEFAEKAGVDVETAMGWEKGTIEVYTKDLMVICPILKIHEEDIIERDLQSERLEAHKKMKTGNARRNYDWYYGSKSKKTFYLLALILIPLVGLLTFFIINASGLLEQIKNDWIAAGNSGFNFPLFYYSFLVPYGVSTLCGSVFMIIELIKRFGKYFRLWYLFWILPLATIIQFAFALALIPYYCYCFYRLVIKKGKN